MYAYLMFLGIFDHDNQNTGTYLKTRNPIIYFLADCRFIILTHDMILNWSHEDRNRPQENIVSISIL